MRNALKLAVILMLLSYENAICQSDIVITEIMYNLPGNDTLEYLELYNKGASPVNLKNYSFIQGVSYTFPAVTLNGGSYLIVARDSVSFLKAFPGVNTRQWTMGVLDNNGEKIVLKDPSGIIADSVEYENGYAWDPTADGTGRSLVLCDPSSNNSVGYNWSASQEFSALVSGIGILYGSPGRGNNSCTAPGDVFAPRLKKSYAYSLTTIGLRFDEPLSQSTAENAANYSGLGTITSAVLNTPDSVTLTLATPLTLGKIDTLTVANVADTNAAPNYMPAKKEAIVFNNTIADLVISEILYNNNGPDTLEFIEVYNKGTLPANVGGYEFTNGVSFTFPSLMTIAPGEYVAIPSYKAIFNSFFQKSVTFDFKGALDNVGEKLTIKNTTGDIIDSLTYSPDWSWRTNPGPSLVLCDVNSDNNIASNWGASGDYKGQLNVNGINYDVWASPGEAGTSCVTGIFSPAKKAGFVVYPNPAVNSFRITFPDNKEREINILNPQGQIVFHEKTSQPSVAPTVNTLPGLYYVEVTDIATGNIEGSKIQIE